MIAEKACTRCEAVKPLDRFYRQPERPDGRHSQCKPCRNAYRLKKRRANPEQNRAHATAWYQRNKKQQRVRNRLGQYRMSPQQYEALLAAQAGLCAICKKPEESVQYGILRALCVDHDHETGAVRGLLCNRCNPMVGMARSNAEVLRSAADYLEAYEERVALGVTVEGGDDDEQE